jgi:hypothetical protein
VRVSDMRLWERRREETIAVHISKPGWSDAYGRGLAAGDWVRVGAYLHH